MDTKKEVLLIQVISSDINPESLVNYLSIGKTFSTIDNINVNKMDYGYAIVYTSDTFETISSLKETIQSIIDLFELNLPGQYFDVGFEYLYERNNGEGDDVIDMDIFQRICSFQTLFRLNNSDHFNIFITKNMKDTLEYIQEDDSDDDMEDDAFDDSNEFDIFGSSIMRNENERKKSFEDFGLDFDGSSIYPDLDQILKKSKNKKKKVRSSRVLMAADNPKKLYHRHGVMVVKGTKAIDKDAKIIKDFLKEFIPGNQEWKKELRHDLCNRWLKMYVITNRQLKDLEKRHKKKIQRKHSYDVDKTLDFTRKLLTVPVDQWNDPTR